jgi:hypothetical protein
MRVTRRWTASAAQDVHRNMLQTHARGWIRHLVCLGSLAALLTGCAEPPARTVDVKTAVAPVKAAKPFRNGPYSIHLLADGHEMELAGDMPEGTTAAIKKMLDTHPTINVIHLNSNGGELREGYRLSELIRQRHLTTYTSTICASACTIAFLAGSPRYLAEDAWLGFHSSSNEKSGEISPDGNVAFYDMYHAAGLPDDFIAQALKTIPSEIWFPSYDELRTAHVVDDVVDSHRFAVSGIAYWKSPAEVDQMLREDDLYAAIFNHDQKAYAQVQSLYLVGARLGHRVNDIDDNAAGVVIDQLLPFYIRKSGDDAILRYQRAYNAKLDYLTEHNPLYCAAINFPELGLPKAGTDVHLPQAIKMEIDEALADVTNSAFEPGRAADKSGDAYMAKIRFFRHLNGDDPGVFDVIDHPERSRDDPATLCRAVADLYKHILEQPPAEAAMILRDFLGST